MISVQELKQAIAESQDLGTTVPVPRDDYFSWLSEAVQSRLIKTVVGFRRSGKSFLLKMLSKFLMEKGVAQENVFYLNFENDLLQNVKTVSDLRHIWEVYLREIADINKPIYVFWDEIQMIKNWERLVRTLYEQGKYNIFISGSNSQLLSGELSSSLSGRSLNLEVKPFSFVEYLQYLKLNHNNYYSQKAAIDSAFTFYLRRGGLCEQFSLEDSMAVNYSESLVQKIILDDIIKRYNIDNVNLLKETFLFVRGNITSTLSLRRIVGRLEEQGISVAATTIENYIRYWTSAYALERLTKFDYKLSRVFSRSAKYYLVDNTFVPGRQENNEKRLENLVYNELVKRYGRENIYFGQEENGYEVDFLINTDGHYLAFQVCLSLNEKNSRRELGNLELVKKHLSANGTVLYLDKEISLDLNSPAKPVIEWLLTKT